MANEKDDTRSVLRGDIFGGLTAAVIALPLALAFGVSAFESLGPGHASTGALVGLLGAIFTGFFAALFGGTPSQVTGPTAPMTVVVTAFLVESVRAHPGAEHLGTIMVLMGVAIVLGGFGQIALGLSGGGKVVEYIPYPVVAGFMNGIAIIIFLGQLKPFFGVRGDWSNFDLSHAWVPMAVGTTTVIALLITKKLSKTIPASLVALLVGVGTYLGLAAADYAPMSIAASNRLVVGAIPNPFTSLDQVKQLVPLFHLGDFAEVGWGDLQRVLTTGATLGVLGAIDSLLTSVVADQVTGTRHNTKQELVGQGIGNIVSGCLGGLAGAGATVRTLVNIDAGGRTKRSGMLHAVLILLVVLLLSRAAGWIPMAALSGILFVTAVNMLDRYSLGLVRKSLVRWEFGVIVVVALVTVVVDLMVAVGVGLAIAGGLFIWQQMKLPPVRRCLRGDELNSRRVRRPEEIELLAEHGARTLAYELSGTLFFGTTDQLLSEIEKQQASADRLIFDFSKVDDMDLTGARVMATIFERLVKNGKKLSVSSLPDLERRSPRVRQLIAQLNVLGGVDEQHRHGTLDLALERFEQDILEEHMPGLSRQGPMPLSECIGFSELEPEERTRLEEAVCEDGNAAAGDVLVEDGGEADTLLLIREGRVSVLRAAAKATVRLASLGPGALWGLRALADGTHWNSSVRADTDVTYTRISRSKLEALRKEDPEVVAHLEKALLKSAVKRLDLLAGELVLLEDA